MKKALCLPAIMLIMASLLSGISSASEIIEVPFTAELVSGNGKAVAGRGYSSEYSVPRIVRWTEEDSIMTISQYSFHSDFFSPHLTGINYDGTVIIGYDGYSLYYNDPYIWTEADGKMQIMEYYGFGAIPFGVSSDGSIITGKYGNEYIGGGIWPTNIETFIWNSDDEFFFPCISNSYGKSISGDGQIVVGNAHSLNNSGDWERSFFVWTTADGFSDIDRGRASDISADGNVIIGTTPNGQAFRYTDTGGIQVIGDFSPQRTNGNGSLIVGDSYVWDIKTGLHDVEDYLILKGVDLDSDGWIIDTVTDISDDGLVLVGKGHTSEGDVVDNQSPDFATTPTGWPWSSFTPGGYEQFYQYAPPGDGQKSATWTFHGDGIPGDFEIFAQWTSGDNRATAATYRIFTSYGSEIGTVTVDQTRNGGKFNSLGIFSSDSGGFNILLNDDPSGYVIADAIKIVSLDTGWMAKLSGTDSPQLDQIEIEGPDSVNENAAVDFACRAYYCDSANTVVPADSWTDNCSAADIDDAGHLTAFEAGGNEQCQITAYYTEGLTTVSDIFNVSIIDTDSPSQNTEVTIDNADAGFSSGPASWPWSSFSPGGYNTHYQYAPPGNGSKWARWRFQIPSSGNCEVFAHWTSGGNRSTAAPYTIISNGTQYQATVDQTVNGGQFVSLGTFFLDAGTIDVLLNDTPTGYVIADAVKVVSE